MKSLVIIWISVLISSASFSQENGTWHAFRDDKNQLTGFKDSLGAIKIAPRFSGLTAAATFRNIIAVTEATNGTYSGYYLLKNGKRVGIDSLYVSDYTLDCEQEGFIRFSDRKADKAGFFDHQGKVAIPADYDDISRFRNGVAVALKGAEKVCLSPSQTGPCEHWGWTGGTTYLIDTDNNILVEDFKDDGDLDWYSLQIEDAVSMDSLRNSYRGVNGRYYTFIHHKRHFEKWLDGVLNKPDKKTLLKDAYPQIAYWKKQGGWKFAEKYEFITLNFEILSERLQEIQEGKTDYFISIDGLNPYIFKGNGFDRYFDDCEEAKREEYPEITVIINHRSPESGKYLYQDQLGFLKTENGYMLISVSLGDDNTK